MSDRLLFNDADVARFLVNGYHLVEPELPDGLNETIAANSTRSTTTPATPSPKPCPHCGRSSPTRQSRAR